MEENDANDDNTIVGKNFNVQKAPSTSLLAAHGQVNNSNIFDGNIFEFECK